jgi:carbonic anhydrase
LGIPSLEESVREDLAWLRSSPFIKKELAERTHGFIYDIKSGKVNKVE